MSPDSPDPLARQAKQASIVILVAMLGWMLGSWLGGYFGLPVHYAFLVDLAALGALAWALIVLYRVWRKRHDA